jgi:hypothetical protein
MISRLILYDYRHLSTKFKPILSHFNFDLPKTISKSSLYFYRLTRILLKKQQQNTKNRSNNLKKTRFNICLIKIYNSVSLLLKVSQETSEEPTIKQ